MNANPTVVYLIRHGEVDYPKGPNGEDLIYGPDESLNQAGKDTMRRLAESLGRKGVSIQRIYRSTLSRAKQSAEILEDVFSFAPIVDVDGLRAKSYPSWVGRPVKELEEAGGILVSREGDETDQEAGDRFWLAVQQIIKRNKGRTIAIVAHGEEITQFMRRKHFSVDIPKNGEGFCLSISEKGIFSEPVTAEIAGRGKEKI